MASKGLKEEDYLNEEIVSCMVSHLGKTRKYAKKMELQCLEAAESNESACSLLESTDEDGRKKYIEKTLTAVRNDDGKCTHILETLRDVTEQKSMELELIENEERLSLIYNSSNDFMALLKVQDVGYSIESVNQVYVDQILDTMNEPWPVE